ncbi:dihydropteroate synthase [Rhodoflexus caldus]|uniref:dihydropteroate synthase n=1 Tax=Rhodoflexus caldus TaxID=2891236 RepID=UPI002029B8B6|nr:dihydropteroate synthase [Rhodoflexus caldus]
METTKDMAFFPPQTLQINGRLLSLDKPRIMGILNITPDSFYGGSRFSATDEALRQAEQMLREGADFLDVGGYSTRPGAAEVPETEEISRVRPVVAALAKKFPQAIISVDTFRASVARVAVGEGANMINDVSGGQADAAMFAAVGELGVPYVLMHSRGNPQTMQQLTHYEDIFTELMYFFQERILQLQQSGCRDIIIDPGFGFAKTMEQNYALLKNLSVFRQLNKPLLVGISRKSMIWKKLGTLPEQALNGTTALHTIALLQGAQILRVHDVKPAAEIIRLLSDS